MFVDLGIPVLDLDKVGYQVTKPGSKGLAALVEHFGEIILDGKKLNRARLAEICFASDDKTQQLNRIVHPLIWQEANRWQKKQRTAYTVIEASALIESGGGERVDIIVVVIAGMQTRKYRALKRKGMTEKTFDAIIARQCSDDQRLNTADYLIRNNGDMKALKREVNALHTKLAEHFGG